MRAMIAMSDYYARAVGTALARARWSHLKAELMITTGAANVASGVLHEWRDQASYYVCAAVSFRSSAWTGR